MGISHVGYLGGSVNGVAAAADVCCMRWLCIRALQMWVTAVLECIPCSPPTAAGRGGGVGNLDEVDMLLAAAQSEPVAQATMAHNLRRHQAQAHRQAHQALWVAAATDTGVLVAGQ